MRNCFILANCASQTQRKKLFAIQSLGRGYRSFQLQMIFGTIYETDYRGESPEEILSHLQGRKVLALSVYRFPSFTDKPKINNSELL